MAFHDVRISTDIERGAVGGPQFSTIVQRSPLSGKEVRVQNWTYDQQAWQIGYGVDDRSRLEELRDFFLARRGRLHSFRFRDWYDYQATDVSFYRLQGPAAEVTAQLGKRYGTINPYFRKITKPVDGTVTLKVDLTNTGLSSATAVASSAFSVDYLTGLVTVDASVFGTATDAVLYWSGGFDIPVRFDTDELQITGINYDAIQTPVIPIVQVDE